MEDVDLIELFSNILDNAIEGSSRVEGDKYIKLAVKQNGNFLTIQCDNVYNPEGIKRSSKGFVTSKTNTFTEKHGIGMSVMRDVVRKYHGLIDFKAGKDLFTVRTNLNLG